MLFSRLLQRAGIFLSSHALSANAVATEKSSITEREGLPAGQATATDAVADAALYFAAATNATLQGDEGRLIVVPFPGLSLPGAQGNQTETVTTDEIDNHLSRRNRPPTMNFQYTHGSIRAGNFTHTATIVDPLQLRLALEECLVEARKRPATQAERYFRLDARNLTLVFLDLSDPASGHAVRFVWVHVVHVIDELLKDIRDRPDFHRSYVGRVQDAHAQVLASVAIQPAFVELPRQEMVAQAREGLAAGEQFDGDQSIGGGGRRPLGIAHDMALAYGSVPVEGVPMAVTWAEREGMQARYLEMIEAINIAYQLIGQPGQVSGNRMIGNMIDSVVTKFGDIALIIVTGEGLTQVMALHLVLELHKLVGRLLRRRLGPRVFGVNLNTLNQGLLNSIAMNVVGGIIMKAGKKIGYWSLTTKVPLGGWCSEGLNCLGRHTEL